MKRYLDRRVIAVSVLGLWTAMAVNAPATPYFRLDTSAEWSAAPITGVTPVAWGAYLAANPGFYATAEPQAYWSSAPQLYVYDGPVVPGVNEAGLVMTWGTTPDSINYTAAWKYAYPEDPNLLNSTVLCSVVPPQFNAVGNQVNSVGVGLVDGAGLIRSWTWNCAGVANPLLGRIAWNQMWNLTMGPIGPLGQVVDPFSNATSPMNPAVVPPFVFFSNPAFNPANVVSIIAIESGQNVGQWQAPPGGVIPLVWNFWGAAGVVPEPGAMCLFALGACSLLGLRRRV